MGPLVPTYINDGLNLILAFFIGIAFGFILEGAGFSSSKKLAGLFYGYDFTVLRVFFTAGVTAMVGVVTLSHFGLLDLDLVYINPLFLYSAIVGGLIMGLGFVIGGFCPGTSMCAAMIGKIDAMLFVIGAGLGIFIFIEGYPAFEGLYKSANLGIPQVSDTFNIPLGVFAFLSIAFAFGSYWVVAKIENKVNKEEIVDPTSKKTLAIITVVALVIGLIAATLQPEKEVLLNKVNDAEFISNYEVNTIDSDELALRFVSKDATFQIIDTRDAAKFAKLTFPNAINIPLKEFFSISSARVFNLVGKTNIIVGENEEESKKGYVLAKELGIDNVLQLKGGFQEFKSEILDFKLPVGDNVQLTDTQIFRQKAAEAMPELIKNAKPKVVKKAPKRALGGCG